MLKARTPFAGFYYSIWDSAIDDFIEREGEEQDDSDLYERIDFSVVRENIAEAYTTAFGQWLSETLERPVEITFAGLSSPRFYNFETDRVFVNLPEDVLQSVLDDLRAKDAETLDRAFSDFFSSRSGFVSFYESKVPSKHIADWDHNELYVLLEAWARHQDVENLDTELYEGVYEKIDGFCYNALREQETS